jgi:hypothetical protein
MMFLKAWKLIAVTQDAERGYSDGFRWKLDWAHKSRA